MEMLTFHQVDGTKFDAIRAKVQESLGIAITEDAGEASQHGFTIKWSYDRQASVLTVQCLRKPFFVPAATLDQHLGDLVRTA